MCTESRTDHSSKGLQVFQLLNVSVGLPLLGRGSTAALIVGRTDGRGAETHSTAFELIFELSTKPGSGPVLPGRFLIGVLEKKTS